MSDVVRGEGGSSKEFGSLDFIDPNNKNKLRLQTIWKIDDNEVKSVDIVLIKKETVWKSSISGWMLQEGAQNLNLEFHDYCSALKYAFVSPWGPKNDIVSFEDGVLKWQKICKTDFSISFADFSMTMVPDSNLLAETIVCLLDSNNELKEDFEKVSAQNDEILDGWNNLKRQTDDMITKKNLMESTLYAKFVAILNEKKNKICDLRR